MLSFHPPPNASYSGRASPRYGFGDLSAFAAKLILTGSSSPASVGFDVSFALHSTSELKLLGQKHYLKFV